MAYRFRVGSKLAVGIALELEGFGAFQEADELPGGEDGAEFDVAILGGDVEPLAGFET
jgi:hypothetical protein